MKYAIVLSSLVVGASALWACGADSEVPAPAGGDAGLIDGGGGGPSAEDTGTPTGDDAGSDAAPGDRLQTVFIIMMENHNWATVKSAPYLSSLAALGGHAENYTTPLHPSELNYVWLEAGEALGITDDKEPSKNHQATTKHLSTMLDAAGISWRAYVEDIPGTSCPLADNGHFVTRHVPQLFFDDVTNTNDVAAAKCIQHIRPYAELATDIANNTLPRYALITPNLCHDMHGDVLSLSGCGYLDSTKIADGDTWLQAEVPKILDSSAYKNNGVLFIWWDEGDSALNPLANASDGPIPLVVLSPKAKPGYSSPTAFTHSSMLRTLQEIFGVTPLLGGAAGATNLSEFFTSFP